MLLYLSNLEGHKESYANLFSNWNFEVIATGRRSLKNIKKMIAAKKIVFGTLDDDILLFSIICLFRSTLGRETFGITIRPQDCLRIDAKSKLRKLNLMLLCRLPSCKLISLIPFDAMPSVARVATDEIHDPQLWDVFDSPPVEDTGVAAQIRLAAAGRPIMAVLGTMSAAKGMNFLAEMVRVRPELSRRLYIVVAAQANADCADAARAIAEAGGAWWERWATDSELATMYAISDFIWSRYEPGYDQASGIFGRAVQWGRRPVIRASAAVVTHYDDILGIGSVLLSDDPAIAADELLAAVQALPGPPAKDNAAIMQAWRESFFNLVAQGTAGRQLTS